MEEATRADLHSRPQEVASEFAQNGYAVIRNLLTGPAREFLSEYALKSSAYGQFKTGDAALPNTPCSYADPMMDSLMEELLPRMEDASGYKLYPTYSYLRVYKQGDILNRHIDRPSCEISLTLSLGYKAAEPWPIWIEHDGKFSSIRLHPGDALLYKGMEIPHWRERFEGEYAVQVFLHYVDQNGPNRDCLYDKRVGLATSSAILGLIGRLQS